MATEHRFECETCGARALRAYTVAIGIGHLFYDDAGQWDTDGAEGDHDTVNHPALGLRVYCPNGHEWWTRGDGEDFDPALEAVPLGELFGELTTTPEPTRGVVARVWIVEPGKYGWQVVYPDRTSNGGTRLTVDRAIDAALEARAPALSTPRAEVRAGGPRWSWTWKDPSNDRTIADLLDEASRG